MTEQEEQRQRRSALQYADALIGALHHDDLKEIEIAVEPDGAGAVKLTIRADVMEGNSSERVLGTTYQFMRRRQDFAGVNPFGIREG